MNIREITKQSRFIVAGHRGFCHLYPENTLLSLQEAVQAGVGMVEFDIGLSKDKIPVLCHDATLDRTTTGTGLVNGYTYAELKKFDAGVKKSACFSGIPIPKFAEVCQWALQYPHLLLNIDLKAGDTAVEAVEPVIDLVRHYSLANRCVFNSGDRRIIKIIHDTYGFMAEGGLNHFEPDADGSGQRLDAVCLHIDYVSIETVLHYKKMGKVVWCWGADDRESLNRAIDCGVTLAVCDHPIVCLEVAQARGLL